MHECVLSVVWCKKHSWRRSGWFRTGDRKRGERRERERGEIPPSKWLSLTHLGEDFVSLLSLISLPHLIASSFPFVTRLILLFPSFLTKKFSVWCNWDQDSQEEGVKDTSQDTLLPTFIAPSFLFSPQEKKTNEFPKILFAFSSHFFFQVRPSPAIATTTRMPCPTQCVCWQHTQSHSCPPFRPLGPSENLGVTPSLDLNYYQSY